MRTTLLVGTTAIALALAFPSLAQTPATPAPGAAPAQSQPQAGGMCACCRNMAMMRQQGQQGQQGGQGGQSMPMEPPRQQ